MKVGSSKQRRHSRRSLNSAALLWVLVWTWPLALASADPRKATAITPVPQPTNHIERQALLDAPLALSVRGNVFTQFAGKRVAVSPLASLRSVERVTLGEGAVLRGLCPDLTTFERRDSGEQALPCLDRARGKLSEMSPMRYVVDAAIPQLLSPRTGFIRLPPTIRWRSVPGASSYRVELRDETFAVVWRQSVHSTQLAYPASAAALSSGQMYSFRVATEQRSSDEDNTDQVFQVMSPAGSERVQSAERRLDALRLSQSARRHVWARILLRFELYAEAFDLLQGAEGAAAALSFGQLLLRTGLHARAQTALKRALPNAAPDLTRAQIRALLAELGGEHYSLSTGTR